MKKSNIFLVMAMALLLGGCGKEEENLSGAENRAESWESASEEEASVLGSGSFETIEDYLAACGQSIVESEFIRLGEVEGLTYAVNCYDTWEGQRVQINLYQEGLFCGSIFTVKLMSESRAKGDWLSEARKYLMMDFSIEADEEVEVTYEDLKGMRLKGTDSRFFLSFAYADTEWLVGNGIYEYEEIPRQRTEYYVYGAENNPYGCVLKLDLSLVSEERKQELLEAVRFLPGAFSEEGYLQICKPVAEGFPENRMDVVEYYALFSESNAENLKSCLVIGNEVYRLPSLVMAVKEKETEYTLYLSVMSGEIELGKARILKAEGQNIHEYAESLSDDMQAVFISESGNELLAVESARKELVKALFELQ